MTDKEKSGEKQPVQKIWEFVPVQDLDVPSPTVERTLKTRFSRFWERLRADRSSEAVFPVSQKELSGISDYWLNRVAPVEDWHAPMETLAESLDGFLASASDQKSFTLIVARPFCGTEPILRHWAASRGLPIINSPNPERILDGDKSILEPFEKQGQPWILPRLEDYFLRHESGLDLMRLFFDRLYDKKFSPGVIVCGSWSWAYLKRVLQAGFLPARILQALDASRLKSWFFSLSRKDCPRKFSFRQIDDGDHIFQSPASHESKKKHRPKNGEYLENLAEYTLGSPEIALDIWRRGLRMSNESESADTNNGAGDNTIWVEPWDKAPRLSLPSGMNNDHGRILHTLLIHNGVKARILPVLLPAADYDARRHIHFLEVNNLVESDQGILRVTALGYPAVRVFLEGENFLTDD